MDDDAARRPGRPRSERARRAVLDATWALAHEREPGEIGMQAIAGRAGVSKETLYRWWRSTTEVFLDVLAERVQEVVALPDTGSLDGDLHVFLRATIDSVDETTLKLLRGVGASAAADRTVAASVRDRFIVVRRAALSQVLERAVQRGELAAADLELTLDFVYGSLWYRLIFDIGTLDHRWADDTARRLSGGPR